MALILRLLITVLSISILTHFSTSAAKILFLLPLSSISHNSYLRPFMEALSSRGHQVTLATGLAQFQVENVTVLPLNLFHSMTANINEKVYHEFRRKPFSYILEVEKNFGPEFCNTFIQNQLVKDMVKKELQFDVAIVMSAIEYCSFPIASLVAKKIIYFNLIRRLLPCAAYKLAVSNPYSFSPHIFLHLSSSMTFGERVLNSLATTYQLLFGIDFAQEDEIIQKIFPNAPNVEDAISKTSLIFTNTDNVFSESVPGMTNVIQVGGMHCRKSKPLPKEFKDAVSGEFGFILFSVGTIANLSMFGEHTSKAFIDAFSMLKETVIWKTDKNYKNLPLNVKTFPWIPQQDVLGHPNIRLFITQGGVFSTHELLYHAVPVLGVPVIGDQFSNIKRLEELGIGKHLDIFSNLTAQEIYNSIKNIIDDSRFKKNADRYSEIFKDNYDLPLNRAVFWTEWLTRHSDVDLVVHPSFEKMNFFKFFMLDCFGLLCAILFVLIILIARLVKTIFCKTAKNE